MTTKRVVLSIWPVLLGLITGIAIGRTLLRSKPASRASEVSVSSSSASKIGRPPATHQPVSAPRASVRSIPAIDPSGTLTLDEAAAAIQAALKKGPSKRYETLDRKSVV